ncbi:transmembrane protein 272-like [Cheilinus undulatus]|uniref:transmembrane protein 272-like n=1 Tax=Cheilinus undulatus TaxID=241271 RepID=UPI001BD3F53D|nr:transmembrane protein 272-like [Cheilinus undulatus]
MDEPQQDEPSQRDFAITAIFVVVIFFMRSIMCLATMIAAIVVGAMNLNTCPIQPYIPIYLIVFGVINILWLSMIFSKSKEGSNNRSTCLIILLDTFSLCWIIAGSCWIYSIYPPSYESGVDTYI